MKKLDIEVASDVVCPWCYIGKRRLEKALALLKDEFPPRRVPQSQVRLARALEADGCAGERRRQGRGHRLRVRSHGDATQHHEAHRLIGLAEMLGEIAGECGVKGWPQDAGDVSKLEEEVRELGISAVPTFIFERRHGVSGAYPAESLAEAMRQAATATTA